MLEPRQNASVASPLPISVGPSQYWDGNDGPWSSFAMVSMRSSPSLLTESLC